jgi:hypothetical protein
MASKASLIAKAFGGGGAFSQIADPTIAAGSRKLTSDAMGGGASGQQVVADINALIALSGMNSGDTVLVSSNNKLYLWNGSGWYIIATVVNDAPSAITGVDGTYTLATDGTATTITAVSTDPEGLALTWSYVVQSGSLGSTATVSQADNVFTITPSTNSAHVGTFTLRFSATDGINGAVIKDSIFELSFTVLNSRYTSLSVKATNTGSNQTFDDASTSNHTITANGNVAAATFSPYRHGGYSASFDGTGDYLNIGSSSDYTFGTGDYTIEMFVYHTSISGQQTYFSDANGNSAGVYFYKDSNHKLGLYYTGQIVTGSGNVPTNQWVHVSVCRASGTSRLFLDGVLQGSASDTTNLTQTAYSIGDSVGSSSGEFIGYISNVRVIKGTAAYTSNFTPPTAPLTAVTNTKFLLGNLPYFKDQSASNHAITVNGNTSLKPFSLFDITVPYSKADHGASVHFGEANGNAIIIPTTAATTSGDYTIEFWIRYNTNKSGAQTLTGVYGQHRIIYSYGRFVDWTSGGTQTYWQNADGTLYQSERPGIWTHFAQTRTSGVVKAWINGVGSANTVTDNTSWTTSRFGSEYNSSSENFEGDMADIRITHSAIYSSDFTPPTAPLTAITNTKFLLNPETSISDLSQRNSLITVGGAAASTTQVKFSGTKSIYIGAQGDYINSIRDSTIPIFPNGDSQDWTLEYWYYPTSIAGFNYIFNIGDGFQMTAVNGGLGIWTKNGGSTLFQQNQMHTVTENTWSHVAIVRNGNNYNVYVDGVSRFNTTNSNEVQTGTNNLHIGDVTPYNNGALNFYIQDFRITKGLARYTANFTPPTAELQG